MGERILKDYYVGPRPPGVAEFLEWAKGERTWVRCYQAEGGWISEVVTVIGGDDEGAPCGGGQSHRQT